MALGTSMATSRKASVVVPIRVSSLNEPPTENEPSINIIVYTYLCKGIYYMPQGSVASLRKSHARHTSTPVRVETLPSTEMILMK